MIEQIQNPKHVVSHVEPSKIQNGNAGGQGDSIGVSREAKGVRKDFGLRILD